MTKGMQGRWSLRGVRGNEQNQKLRPLYTVPSGERTMVGHGLATRKALKAAFRSSMAIIRGATPHRASCSVQSSSVANEVPRFEGLATHHVEKSGPTAGRSTGSLDRNNRFCDRGLQTPWTTSSGC